MSTLIIQKKYNFNFFLLERIDEIEKVLNKNQITFEIKKNITKALIIIIKDFLRKIVNFKYLKMIKFIFQNQIIKIFQKNKKKYFFENLKNEIEIKKFFFDFYKEDILKYNKIKQMQ